MMNHFVNQVVLGAWGAMALGFGIMSHSLSTGLNFAAIGVFFAIGMWSCSATNHERQVIRRTARVLLALFLSVFIVASLFVVERLYLVNGTSYPAWLATRDLGTLSEAKLMTFAASSECRGGAEIMDKANGLVVIRCGGLMRYEAGTFIAHREDVR